MKKVLKLDKVLKFFRNHSKIIIITTILLGIFLRFYVASRGHNYDLDSYKIVAEIVNKGGNVYNETFRYNYGPIWFNVLGFLYKIALHFDNTFAVFRLSIVGVLTLADIGIMALLFKMYGRKAGILFFLNPISIIITGYHSQFDNIAIFFALLAIFFYIKKSPKNKIAGYCILGISLVVKHVFFIFPFWLMLKEKGWKNKILVITIPIMIFLLSFVPYLADGFNGIRDNVFLYASSNNRILYNLLMPDGIVKTLPIMIIFISILLFFGFLFRKESVKKLLILYTLILVAFSPSISNQYLAIVSILICVEFNLSFILFGIVTTFLLLVDLDGLHYKTLQNICPDFLYYKVSGSKIYSLSIFLLFTGLLEILIKNKYYPTIRLSKKVRKFEI